jgi:hypothetical protein
MARIRKLEIRNYRSVLTLEWFPARGVNCLIGPGDSGKSTILDAIDLCLGARRTVAISDIDFHNLDVTQPISITVTLGSLPEALQNLDIYGDFLRSFNPATGAVGEEPEHGLETVLSINVTVGADLEPIWALVSAQAQAAGIERGLRWSDRLAVAPARLGNYLNAHLGWTRGSVLNRLSEDAIQLGPQLAQAARQAMASFGQAASEPLRQALDVVNATAQSLGIPVGQGAQALLDAHSVSIGDGAVALHNEAGVPLRSLGTGSARLLIAGLQRAAFGDQSGIVLVDEVETGLEPHRLQRLLMSLGAKDAAEPLQVFLTTHSPVTVRELNAKQLWVLRQEDGRHVAHWAGWHDEAQGTARATPEALLAKTVILCEGASEVGLVRGLDMYWWEHGHASLLSAGAIAVSVGGGSPEKGFLRGQALRALGYRTIVLVDNDKPTSSAIIAAHQAVGGRHIQWEANRATEHELFLSLGDGAVRQLLERAVEVRGRASVADSIRSRSQQQRTLDQIERESYVGGFDAALRQFLGEVAHKSEWFKQQGIFEAIAREIVGPSFGQTSPSFQQHMNHLFGWAHER